MAAWADVLFLCCLLSHLPRRCADLHSRLPKCCLVYNFISAVSVTRLAQLLGHDFILKPQYDLKAADEWLSCSALSTALKDPLLIDASSPLTTTGSISLSVKWTCAVLYGLLNICTPARLRPSNALALINDIFDDKSTPILLFNMESLINSSSGPRLPGDE